MKADTIDTVNSKQYELLALEFEEHYDSLIEAIDIVKEFIIDRKLIVYGGTAIDFALRLFGDKIYPDDSLKIPDLDFYSPNNVKDSYELADILYEKNFKEVRSINAQHTETMRVDLIDNHFIADMTYMPQEVFDKLPYIIYNGMRVLHPDMQRLDIHSSLSFPFDNVPREVIFHRWEKDITRFNLINKYYPIKSTAGIVTRPVVIDNKYVKKQVLTGFAAYALLFTEYIKNNPLSDKIVKSSFSSNSDTITFPSLNDEFEIVHYNLDKITGEFGGNFSYYEPYINLIPMKAVSSNIIIYSSKGKLVSVNSIEFNGKKYRITNIQYLLKHFLSLAMISKDKLRQTYLSYYNSLLVMCNSKDSLFQLSINTYGNENINLAREIALNRLNHDVNGEELYYLPINYYPSRSRARGVSYPDVKIEDIKFFRESGKLIE